MSRGERMAAVTRNFAGCGTTPRGREAATSSRCPRALPSSSKPSRRFADGPRTASVWAREAAERRRWPRTITKSFLSEDEEKKLDQMRRDADRAEEMNADEEAFGKVWRVAFISLCVFIVILLVKLATPVIWSTISRSPWLTAAWLGGFFVGVLAEG